MCCEVPRGVADLFQIRHTQARLAARLRGA
jgi:hypothetical protein